MQSFFFWANKAEYGYPEGPFFTEQQWQNSVSEYGVCGKFVYSEEGVRLPKITGFVEGTLDETALGDLVEAGLPNITGWLTSDEMPFYNGKDAYQSGALYQTSSATGQNTATGSSATSMDINFDASRSNSIYGNSDTVQPQAIKGYMYMVVATATKTKIEVDIDNVATDINAVHSDVATLNTRLDGAVFVVESWTDGTNWYRKYSDGWVEQGGGTRINARSTVTVTFPIAHTSVPRVLVSSGAAWSGGTNYSGTVGVNNRTTTGFTAIQPTEDSAYWTGFNWLAMGY